MLEFIIPAYGESKHLDACIKSLLNQSVLCPISIATSTPSSFLDDISKKYGIPLFINPNRDGISADWNFALSVGTQELRVLAHQDDLYDLDFAKKAINFYMSNSSVGLFFTDAIEIDGDSNKEKMKREFIKRIIRSFAYFPNKKIISSNPCLFYLLGFGCPIPCPSVIYNWSFVSKTSFSKNYTVNLDWDYWSRVASAGIAIGYLRGKLVTHRIHSDAETQIAIVERRRHDEDTQIFSRFWPSFFVPVILFFYKLGY